MTFWGWKRTDKAGGIDWVPGSLEDSYTRVSRFGGRWILVSASPVRDYYRVLEQVAAKREARQ